MRTVDVEAVLRFKATMDGLQHELARAEETNGDPSLVRLRMAALNLAGAQGHGLRYDVSVRRVDGCGDGAERAERVRDAEARLSDACSAYAASVGL